MHSEFMQQELAANRGSFSWRAVYAVGVDYRSLNILVAMLACFLAAIVGIVHAHLGQC